MRLSTLGRGGLAGVGLYPEASRGWHPDAFETHGAQGAVVGQWSQSIDLGPGRSDHTFMGTAQQGFGGGRDL